ncbi:hypothetical protein CBR_g52249 [Chara braunii]|uniref:Serpin domain-containing protein n=1 Tax=Chara braunii TaxID=69332 RepID=A0A388MA74_CHABU|nr:hypothetical protein CBR_g52249 [Chara braunii]|eukprot:GBG91362.1 hypothetical protein CBR_g52249 [Chara braunii]
MLELYRAALSEGGKGSMGNESNKPLNIAVSPVSIALALAVVSGGAAGNTLTEILNVLRLPADLAIAHSSLTSLRRNLLGGPTSASTSDSVAADVRRLPADLAVARSSLTSLRRKFNRLEGHTSASTSDSAAAVKVQIATGLWVTDQLPLKKEYEDHVAMYEGRVVPADFVGAASQVREEINRWVRNQTSGKIQEIVPQGLLNEASVFVLVNTLYFKGLWQKVFRKECTHPGNFMIPAKGGGLETVSVPMMRNKGSYSVGNHNGFRILRLPYRVGGAEDRRQLAMYIFLPDEVDGLAKMEGSLTAELLEESFGNMYDSHLTTLLLPKFKVASGLKLNQLLKDIGMKSAFDLEISDFSNLFDCQDRGICISDVLHDVCVEVDEHGTVAVAATVVVMLAGCSRTPPPPNEFIVDHPFLFMIREDRSGVALFLGRVVDPRPSD